MTYHILLVEDDKIASYVTQKILKQCGFPGPIDVVQDGKEALEYLACEGCYARRETGNPSLIVLDLQMPDPDGFEVLKHIRSTPMLVGIPVFILSASSSQEDVYRSNLLGISRYMVKPLSVSEFTPEINRLLVDSKGDASAAK